MPASCSLFDLDRPPLLKTCGFGFLSTHPTGPQNVENFDFELDPKVFFTSTDAGQRFQALGGRLVDDAPPFKGSVVRKRFWQLTEPPMKLASTQKVIKTMVFNSSIRQLETLKAAVSATVGGSFGPVSVEVTGSLESGIETERTFSSESIEEREVTLDGGKAYAFWELAESVEMTFEPYFAMVRMPGALPDLPLFWKPDGPISGTTVIGIFQDEAMLDELPAE